MNPEGDAGHDMTCVGCVSSQTLIHVACILYGARVTVRLKLDGTSLELGVAKDSLRALLHSRVPNADLDLLEGPSGPLVVEHQAAKAIEQLERALKRRIVVSEIEDGDGEPTDQSRPVLHAAFDDETIPG